MNKYVTVKNNKTGITREITQHTYNLLKNKRIYTLIGEAPAPAAIKKSESVNADRVESDAQRDAKLVAGDTGAAFLEEISRPQRKKPGPKPKNQQNA